MKKTVRQTTAAAPEPQAGRSPVEIMQSFVPQVAEMTAAVLRLRAEFQSSVEVVPAAEREALGEAADGVRAAKRELTRARNELAAAQADCERLARQGVSDDELRAANESAAAKKISVQMAFQRYQAALDKQECAASTATSAGIRPTAEKAALLRDTKRQCMGRSDVTKGEPTLGELAQQLLGALEQLGWAVQFEEQSDKRNLVHEQVGKLMEGPLRVERPLSVEQEYANKLDREQQLVGA